MLEDADLIDQLCLVAVGMEFVEFAVQGCDGAVSFTDGGF
jgi:hypothetical protein